MAKIKGMEIRKLEIDFDKNILKINGECATDKAILVTLPGPEGWPLYKVFNSEKRKNNNQEEYDKLTVLYKEAINNKP